MSVFRGMRALREMGVDDKDLRVVFSFLQKHAHDDYKGGMHTNGGCSRGGCDYGCQLCQSFTAMCEALGKRP